ncbi:hypothetical protein QR680_014668 [Steinernema hermaphroditum]|uniref:CCR4-NOT transcription complex subunit 1 n=1 Tax=Steinernema hermaphroditum TaxID=289476 RepID=A0AA39M4N0_9BILA|nr:hypothetical protein QR680_014668 [Steinernema hermaphroditum]
MSAGVRWSPPPPDDNKRHSEPDQAATLVDVCTEPKSSDSADDSLRRYTVGVLCDELLASSRGLSKEFCASVLQALLRASVARDSVCDAQLFHDIVEGVELALQKCPSADKVRSLIVELLHRLSLNVLEQTLFVHSIYNTSVSTECLNAALDLLKALIPQTVQALIEDDCRLLTENCKYEFAHLFLSIVWNPQQTTVRREDVDVVFEKLAQFEELKSEPILGALLRLRPTPLDPHESAFAIHDVDDAFLQPIMDHLSRDNVHVLAAQIREIGYPFTASVEICIAHLRSFGAFDSSALTSAAVAQLVTMMVMQHADHKNEEIADLCYNGKIFAEAVNRINPSLSWPEVIAHFDQTGLAVRSRQVLRLLTDILVTGIGDPNAFPSNLLYQVWPNNRAGQFTWLQWIIQNPDIFYVLDFPHTPVNMNALKIQPDELSKDVVQWKCLNLVDVLLKLAETQFTSQVYSVFCALPISPLTLCPDLLLLGLIHASGPMRSARIRLIQECVTALLTNSQNAIGVLNAAWNCDTFGTRVLRHPILQALLIYYSKSPDDQSRLTKILEIGHELKPNGLAELFGIQGQYPFTIDLACLASKRDYLKLDKWIDDKFMELGEPFAYHVVQHIKRRLPAALVAGAGSQLLAGQDTLMTLLSILQQKNIHSQELLREVQTLMQQMRLAQAKNGSAPRPGTLPPTIPLGLNLPSTPGTPTGPPPAGSPQSLMSQQMFAAMQQRNSLFGGNGAATNGAVQRSSSVGAPQNAAHSFGVSNTPLNSGFGSGPVTPPNPAALNSFGGNLSPSHQMMRSGSQSYMTTPNVHRGTNATTPSTPNAPFAGSGWDINLGGRSGASTPGSQPPPIDFRSLAPSAATTGRGTPPLIDSRQTAQSHQDDTPSVFSDEIQEEANTYFQMIYAQSQQMSVEQFVQKLKQFKQSSNTRDQEILGCVIKNLFDEFRFFKEYPERELKTTAEVYGGIIREDIIQGLQMATALRRISDAINSDNTSMLFKFACVVLNSCKMRLHQFASMCQLIQSYDNFAHLPSVVREFIKSGVTGQIPSAYQQQYLQIQKQQQALLEREKLIANSQRNPSAHANHGRDSPGKLISSGPRPTSGMLTQANIETLVKLTEKEGARIADPPTSVVERVSFLFNNLSQSNLPKKTEEMKILMVDQGDRFMRWIAQYLVMTRVSIEANFHPLYSNFVNSFGDKIFETYVRKETFRSIKVLLKSDKRASATNFSDRQLIKNLGSFLGMITIAKDRPIGTAELDLKSLLMEAYYKGQQELMFVVPFVAKILASCAKSQLFGPECAWIRAILNVLAELHNEPDLKLNLKFEIEVLCKELGVSLNDEELGTEGILKNTDRLCRLRQQLGDLKALKQPEAQAPPGLNSHYGQSVISSSASPIPNSLRPADMDGGASSGRNSANICTPVNELVSAAGSAADPSAAAAAAAHTAGMALASAGSGSAAPVNNAQFHYHDINVNTFEGLVPHLKIRSHLALFQSHPNLKATVRTAIHHAVKELIGPVTDRAIKVAMSVTEHIVRKDFILDGEDKNLRRAAHLMMRAMTAGMAAITCRDPLQTTMATYLKQYFASHLSSIGNPQDHIRAVDEAVAEITADNVELATSFVVKSACEKASQEVDKRLTADFEERTRAKAEHKKYIGSQTHYHIQQRMPEQIQVLPGPIGASKFKIYDEFVKKICGFKASSMDDQLLDQLAKNPGGVGAAIQQSQMNISNVSTFVSELQKIVETIDERVNHIGQTPNLDEVKSFKALLLMKELFSQAIAYPRDTHIVTPLLQRVVEQFLNAFEVVSVSSTAVYSKMIQVEWSGFLRDTFVSFYKCIVTNIAHNDLVPRITQILCECRLDYRFNYDAVAFLLRNHLINPVIYDKHLAVSMDNGNNLKVVQFVTRLFKILHEMNQAKGNASMSQFQLQSMMPQCCDVLSKIQLYTTNRQPATAEVHPLEAKTTTSGEDLHAKRTIGSDGNEYDPELQTKVENILKHWIHLCSEATFQSDPQTALQHIVSMMHEQGVLSTDEMITRFLRLCTDIIVDVSYRLLQNDSGAANRARCYRYLDAFVKLTCLMIKFSDGNQYHTKINLLKKVLSIITTVAQYDHDHRHKQDFQSMPYHRMLISMFNDLTVADPLLEPMAWNILEAFGQALFLLQPRRTPGFAFSWLDIIGHRNFISRILTRSGDSAEKARAMYTQLIICHLKFLSPFLRNLTLPPSIHTMYTGTLRVLLVILHDFPEVLCEYHYVICDAIPPNCVQLRNLVLSAYPRGMKLPDPFDPSLLTDLAEMQKEPKITRAVDIFRADIRTKLDEYLRNRSPVSFLTELPQVLQVSNTPGSKYNMSVINSIVLYVGMRAVESINKSGLHINLTTIAHSSFMDVFQNLSVLLCTEGRYLLFNAIANQLRYPNAHTNYFSNTLLYLFREANSEEIQEQITRILFERLIAIRPHPWGLLITFIELIRNESYGFWKHDFVRCAPEIERLFQTVAASCNVRRQPQLPQIPHQRPTAIVDPMPTASH